MNKNLCLNDSEKEWLLKVKSILSKPQPPIPMPPSNEIWYRSSDKNVVNPNPNVFGANIVSNTYENGIGIITFDGDVTGIGMSAFSGCTGLSSITIPDSVTSIGMSAFSGCSSLISITIPDSVTSIGGATFQGCTSLTSIIVSDSNNVYDSRNNCNAIIKTSTNELIRGCNNTIIPNSVTTIISGAFENCNGLTSVTIPDSVTTIGNGSFYNCNGLTSITIGNSVTSIGAMAFDGCSGVTSITSLNTTPPTIDSSTLPDHKTYIIYVPSESVEAYKAKQYWSSKKNQIQAIQ